jgi:regulator of sigma E protease
MILISVLAFLIIFTMLVVAHESGHFWMARWFGVKVEEFAVGLPPKIFSRIKKGTTYSVNLLPLGGFVRLKGEGDSDQDKDSLAAKPAWVRMLVALAGIAMNCLLAYVIILIGFFLHMPPLVGDPLKYADRDHISSDVIVLGTVEGSAAAQAGFKLGDKIMQVEDASVKTAVEVQQEVAKYADKPVAFVVSRNKELVTLHATPTLKEGHVQTGLAIDSQVTSVSYRPFMVPYYALLETGALIKGVALAFASLIIGIFTKGQIPPDITGPVGIAKMSGQVIALGLFATLQFIVLLSVNLGVLNAIPFPALDGGRFVFALIEWFRGGKRVPPAVENAIHTVGFGLLIILIVIVTFKDLFA